MRNFTERLLQFRPNFKSRVSHSFTFTDCNTGHGDLDLLSKNAVLALDSKIPLLKLTGRWKLHLERVWQMTGCVPHSIQAWLQVALSPVSACTNLALHRRFKPRNQQGMLSFWAPVPAYNGFANGFTADFSKVSSSLQGRFQRGISNLTLSCGSRKLQPTMASQKGASDTAFPAQRFLEGAS